MVRAIKKLKMKTLGVIVAALGVSLACMTAPAANAVQAQANPYTPAGVCNSEAPGSGYYVQRSHALKGARVYQLYNGSYNCVVTIKTASLGTPTLTNACIKVTGTGWKLQ